MATSTSASRANRPEITSEEIDRGRKLLEFYVREVAPEGFDGTYGTAITAAIRDLLALADNHAWRFDVEANLLQRVMHHVDDIIRADDEEAR